jgi:predicted dehydrogenase
MTAGSIVSTKFVAQMSSFFDGIHPSYRDCAMRWASTRGESVEFALMSKANVSKSIRIGLLAYGAIGHEHNLAVQATNGLELTAVCDTNPDRIVAAKELAPDVASFSDALTMLDSGTLDLVVISTPPNSHYAWAKEALQRNIHVVLEKPMALRAEECDELMALAAVKGLLLVVYQNRRFDADFVTMSRIIREGLIGDVFQYDCFVGGYSQPCTYWHSNAEVSGGAIFDWGSHFIDQILAVIPDSVSHVSGQNHKRVWMHATNADHAQVTITFDSGVQATFVNSDLAAARKPKFYVLGTKGAIVGDWDPAAEPAVADLPAILTLHSSDGSVSTIDLDVVQPYAFHASLVDFLHNQVPMSVQALQSRNVVAIMEAAERSAVSNATPVSLSLKN